MLIVVKRLPRLVVIVACFTGGTSFEQMITSHPYRVTQIVVEDV